MKMSIVAGLLLSALLVASLSTAADRGRAQATTADDSSVAGRSREHTVPSEPAGYCPELKQVAALARSVEAPPGG